MKKRSLHKVRKQGRMIQPNCFRRRHHLQKKTQRRKQGSCRRTHNNEDPWEAELTREAIYWLHSMNFHNKSVWRTQNTQRPRSIAWNFGLQECSLISQKLFSRKCGPQHKRNSNYWALNHKLLQLNKPNEPQT